MAEALGLASGVIAVVDATVKVGSTYLKLRRLWNEVKEVPESLRSQTEEIKDLEDYLLDFEGNLATSPLPESSPSRTLLERHIAKCRSALVELRDAVDLVYAKVTDNRGFRRKLAATRAILRKDDLDTLASKFERALKLFQLAQAQEQRLIAIATYAAMVNAKSQGSLIEAPSGPPKKSARRKKPAGAFPILRLGSDWPSLIGKFCLGHERNGSFHLIYVAPTWLTQSVYSLLVQRETMGWQINLRAYEVVRAFDGQLFSLIREDDATGVPKYLYEHKMTPFVRTSYGENLLNLAAFFDAYGVMKLLLEHDFEDYATDFFDHSGAWITKALASPYQNFQMLKLLDDLGLDDYLDTMTCGDFGRVLSHGISRRNYEDLLAKSGFENESLSFSDRLTGAMSLLVSDTNVRWSLHDLTFLLPEIKDHGGLRDILEFSKGLSAGCLLHTLAIGMTRMSRALPSCAASLTEQQEEEKRWTRVLVACIKADPTALQHVEAFWLWVSRSVVTCTPLAAIISHPLEQRSVVSSWLGFSTTSSLTQIRTFFSVWIETVAAAGIDLLAYGREERRLQREGLSTIQQRLCARDQQHGGDWYNIDSRASIVGITYGSLPSQWQLWIVDHDCEYAAGEFWGMIEAQEVKVPGAWINDPVDGWEETESWLRERPSPLIWSEYRKIRPPV